MCVCVYQRLRSISRFMILLHVTYKISLVERRVAQLNSENADETAAMLICPLHSDYNA